MAVNKTPVLKRCRSLGLDPSYVGIDKKSKRKIQKTNRKMSEYGLQLREKQKAKFIYGVQERQFRNLYAIAERQEGITSNNLMVLLERRLDNVVYQMGIAATRREARQLVSHAHFLLNGKKCNIPSLLVKPGDKIEVREKSRSSVKFQAVREAGGYKTTPEWLQVDIENLNGTVASLPTVEQIGSPIETQLIVELYSR